MWLQLAVKKTCCTRKNCTFCAAYYETVTLSYFGHKSSTLKVFHSGNCTGSSWLSIAFFAKIWVQGNRFDFLPLCPVTWRRKINLLWLLCDLPTSHLSDLNPYPSSPFPPHLMHTGLLAGFGTRQVLLRFWAFALTWHILPHIHTWFAPSSFLSNTPF